MLEGVLYAPLKLLYNTLYTRQESEELANENVCFLVKLIPCERELFLLHITNISRVSITI